MQSLAAWILAIVACGMGAAVTAGEASSNQTGEDRQPGPSQADGDKNCPIFEGNGKNGHPGSARVTNDDQWVHNITSIHGPPPPTYPSTMPHLALPPATAQERATLPIRIPPS